MMKFRNSILIKLTLLLIVLVLVTNDYSSRSRENIKSGAANLVQNALRGSHPAKGLVKSLLTKPCNQQPQNLQGNFTLLTPSKLFNSFTMDKKTAASENILLNDVRLGGSWTPVNCTPRHNIAIIIPYKNRADNLNTWLFNMHPFLQRQEISYTIFVVEQINDQLFNKGILMNSAFIEIFNKSKHNFECLIFHDVDLLPTSQTFFFYKYSV